MLCPGRPALPARVPFLFSHRTSWQYSRLLRQSHVLPPGHRLLPVAFLQAPDDADAQSRHNNS